MPSVPRWIKQGGVLRVRSTRTAAESRQPLRRTLAVCFLTLRNMRISFLVFSYFCKAGTACTQITFHRFFFSFTKTVQVWKSWILGCFLLFFFCSKTYWTCWNDLVLLQKCPFPWSSMSECLHPASPELQLLCRVLPWVYGSWIGFPRGNP